MQLSILLPTNRHGPMAISKIAQACSWAGPRIQVIVRDNSGNAEKRALLKNLQRDYCQIISVDPCEGLENYRNFLNWPRATSSSRRPTTINVSTAQFSHCLI